MLGRTVLGRTKLGRTKLGRTVLGRTVLGRIHRIAAVAWSVVAVGASLGFVARDLLGLPPVPVALAWTAGALLALALGRSRSAPIGSAPDAETEVNPDIRG